MERWLLPRTSAIVERLEAKASRHRWLIAAADASAAGLSRHTQRRLLENGRWLPLARGVSAVAGRDGGPFQQAAAELRAAGRRSYLQARTAAAVHGGLDLAWDGSVDLFVVGSGSGRRRRRALPTEHLVVVKGLRVTDPLQTLLDLACVLDPTPWEWCLEAALRQRLTSVERIEEALAAPGRRVGAGVSTVRTVLAVRPSGTPATDSLLETMFVQLVRTLGLPDPERQVEVWVSPDRRYVVDFAWPAFGIFIELDGEHHKGQPVYDAARQTAVTAVTSWICGRFTWTQVIHNPTPTGRDLTALFASAQQRPMGT